MQCAPSSESLRPHPRGPGAVCTGGSTLEDKLREEKGVEQVGLDQTQGFLAPGKQNPGSLEGDLSADGGGVFKKRTHPPARGWPGWNQPESDALWP